MRNNRGSALVWAVSSMLVLMIVVVGALTLGGSYAGRSVMDNSSRQAYLTARSAVDVMLAQIDGYEFEQENEEGIWTAINAANPLLKESGVSVDGFDFPPEMGEIIAASVMPGAENIWTVSATARCGNAEETVTAQIKLKMTVIPPSTSGKVVMSEEFFHGMAVNDLDFSRAFGTSTININNCSMYMRTVNKWIGTAGNPRLIDMKGGGGFFTQHELLVPTVYDYEKSIELTYLVDYVYIDNASEYNGEVAVFDAIMSEAGNNIKHAFLDDEDEIEFVKRAGTLNGLGSGDKFFDINGNASLNLKNAHNVTLYMIVRGGVTLTINRDWNDNNPAHMYIYGEPGSTIHISSNDVTIRGAIVADKMHVENGFTFYYIHPATGISFAIGDEDEVIPGSATYEWEFMRYE